MKSIEEEIAGLDPVIDKIVAAALAIITIAIIVFVPLVNIGIDSLATQVLVYFGQAMGNDYAEGLVGEDRNLPQRIKIDLSIADIFGDDASATAELARALSAEKDKNALEKLEPLIAPAIVFAIALLDFPTFEATSSWVKLY